MWLNRAQAFGALLAVVSFQGTQAQPANPPISGRELIIATKEAPPFVIKGGDGTLHGISIDLWRRIADRLQLRYQFSEQATVQALLAGTAEGSFDAAIAALTVTAARDRIVDFTQPFYATGLGIAVPLSESRMDIGIPSALFVWLFSGRAGARRYRHIGGICDLALGARKN